MRAVPIASKNVGPEQRTPLKKICDKASSPEGAISKRMLDPASRAFHRPITSTKLFPSDKFATSVAIGYHATYPAPRTAVNFASIWSQSMLFAASSGMPIRVNRVASGRITPS